MTCVLHTKAEIKRILEDMQDRSINHVLALRGDPPKDDPGWRPGPDNFRYSSELVAFIRNNFGRHFTIAVAGFPELPPSEPCPCTCDDPPWGDADCSDGINPVDALDVLRYVAGFAPTAAPASCVRVGRFILSPQ